jgi:hypothetical protein
VHWERGKVQVRVRGSAVDLALHVHEPAKPAVPPALPPAPPEVYEPAPLARAWERVRSIPPKTRAWA